MFLKVSGVGARSPDTKLWSSPNSNVKVCILLPNGPPNTRYQIWYSHFIRMLIRWLWTSGSCSVEQDFVDTVTTESSFPSLSPSSNTSPTVTISREGLLYELVQDDTGSWPLTPLGSVGGGFVDTTAHSTSMCFACVSPYHRNLMCMW